MNESLQQPRSGTIMVNKPPGIVETVMQAIQGSTKVKVRDLDVRRDGTHVVLTGRCVSYYYKQQVQQAALGILDPTQGVEIDNQIEVDEVD